jgi:hypothetical protein
MYFSFFFADGEEIFVTASYSHAQERPCIRDKNRVLPDDFVTFAHE